MLQLTTKLELNVFNTKSLAMDMPHIGSFAIKNRIPCIVTEPQLIDIILMERSKFSPAFKVICAIDFFNKNYALQKMRGLSNGVFMADGFEFRVSPGHNDKESLNELRALTEFVKTGIGPSKEIRWALCLRTITYDNYMHLLDHMRKWPASFIRTDINLECPSANFDAHMDDINFIRGKIATPIKVSGNINHSLMLTLGSKASRFDVNLTQARRILKDALEHDKIEKEAVAVDEKVIAVIPHEVDIRSEIPDEEQL